jgi:RES domain-containing protein
MLIYRITLARFSDRLVASGRAARWNPNDVSMIYAASSRSLACLENVVHRHQTGLSHLFSIMIIECPDILRIETIDISKLPTYWKNFGQMKFTQNIGEHWIRNNRSALLRVPSSIIAEEVNYLINPNHPDFKLIKLLKTHPFVFDERIKE